MNARIYDVELRKRVLIDKMDESVKILGLLRSNKMQFSMNAAAGPHLGLAAEESPFEVIKRKQIFLDLFAWHSPKENAPASKY